MLRRQVARPQPRPADRVVLAALSQTLPCARSLAVRADDAAAVASLTAEGKRPQVLIRDRDVELTKGFDAFLGNEGISGIRTPIAAPKAKAHAERWVGSVRRECLDRTLILSRSHLERVLREYAHHNTHRPHRALDQQPPIPKPTPIRPPPDQAHIRRRDRLSGLLHEYELAA